MPDEPLAQWGQAQIARLLVPVTGLSGRTYPPGTIVSVTGRGSSLDGFAGGDWLPLSWWEFADVTRQTA